MTNVLEKLAWFTLAIVLLGAVIWLVSPIVLPGPNIPHRLDGFLAVLAFLGMITCIVIGAT